MTDTRSSSGSAEAIALDAARKIDALPSPMYPGQKKASVQQIVLKAMRAVAQAAPVPVITDAMVEAGARVQATRHGHKNCDETITTTNKGKVPVWRFYTEEPRAILEAALAVPSTEGK